MACLTILLQWLACLTYCTQGRRLHDVEQEERHIPVTHATSSTEVYRSISGADTVVKLDSRNALANVLLKCPHRPCPMSRQTLQSRQKPRAQLSPLIGLSAIAGNLVAPAKASAEEAASGGFNFPFDVSDLLGQSQGLMQYVIDHFSDLATLATVLFAIKIFFSSGQNSRMQNMQIPDELAKALGLKKGPKEFLKIERLNAKLESFDFSFQKAIVSEEAAVRQKRKLAFNHRFGTELASFNLDADALTKIEEAEEKYRKADAALRTELGKKLIELRATAMGANKNESENGMQKMMNGVMKGNPQKEVAEIQAKRFQLEMEFLSAVSMSLSSEQASQIVKILKPDQGTLNSPLAGTLDAITSLENVAASARSDSSKHVWVLKFNGDVAASQVASLRQEVTALLRVANATRGDEALLVLNTGGGTVTGYGLAAAQLMRIKNAGIHLTISVEQVAASGGYMMACVADKIFAAPFAVLGSIGVITEQPNVYERLQKEGIEFSTVTAGKYKRTLTPTKKIDEEDKKKLKEDIERILVLFKDFVAKSRPSVDIEKIATGETWFGPDALANGLVDGLSTVDEILTDHVSHGAQVFSIMYQDKPASPLAALGLGAQGLNGLSAAPTWRELAMALLTRLAAPGTTAALQDSILAASEAEAYENEFMLKRPAGEVDPMLRWGGEKSPADLWQGF